MSPPCSSRSLPWRPFHLQYCMWPPVSPLSKLFELSAIPLDVSALSSCCRCHRRVQPSSALQLVVAPLALRLVRRWFVFECASGCPLGGVGGGGSERRPPLSCGPWGWVLFLRHEGSVVAHSPVSSISPMRVEKIREMSFYARSPCLPLTSASAHLSHLFLCLAVSVIRPLVWHSGFVLL